VSQLLLINVDRKGEARGLDAVGGGGSDGRGMGRLVVSVWRGVEEGGICHPWDENDKFFDALRVLQALHCDLARGVGYDVKGKAADIVCAEEARTRKERWPRSF
jgi:hypothetical protein